MPPALAAKRKAFSAVCACIAVASWAILFAPTYGYSFYWDDFHIIRPYSTAELLSTLHGPHDPDRVETPALRPAATLVFAIQGSLIGDHVRLQRVALTAAMTALLFAIGLLLSELGLDRPHIVIVLALFVASRVFTSLMVWITQADVIVANLLYVIAVFCSLRWIKEGRRRWAVAAIGCVIVAVFTREEAYTLPVVAAILGGVLPSSDYPQKWRRLAICLGGMFVIVLLHLGLRSVFIRDAPRPQLSGGGLANVEIAMHSSWRPVGSEVSSRPEVLADLAWSGFLAVLGLTVICFGRDDARRKCVVAFIIGSVLSLPALGIPRAYGVALPFVAFMSAVAIATVETVTLLARQDRRWGPAATIGIGFCSLGILIGVVGGIVRSRDVAAGLDDNCAKKVLRDGGMLFDLHAHPVTIPALRRAAGLVRLGSLGIHSPEDLDRLEQDVERSPGSYRKNYAERRQLFLPWHDYLAF